MRLWPLVLCALTACGDSSSDDSDDSDAAGDTDATSAAGPGTLLLSFAMEEDLIPGMADPPVGDFNGSVFREDDASAIGPNDGAEPVEDLLIAIDLTAGEATEVATSGDLDPGIYWILGCLDVDDNGCDTDDPITVPNENKFLVEADAESPARVFMGMLNPT